MKDDEFECPECGAIVNINELSRCPQCGLDFYSEEESHQEKVELDENESDDFVHPPPRRLYAPSIEETEVSLRLTVAVLRKGLWVELIKNSSYLALMGIIAASLLYNPSTFGLGVAAGILVSFLAIYDLLYLFVGSEVIEVSQDAIIVRYGIGALKRSRQYAANRIKDLRCTDTIYLQRKEPYGKAKTVPGYVWEPVVDTRTNAIVCEYDGQTVSLLKWLEKSLARRFVSLVKQRFPNYK